MKPSLYQTGKYFSEKTVELIEKMNNTSLEEAPELVEKMNNTSLEEASVKLNNLTGRWREDIKTIFEESIDTKISTIVLNDYEDSKEIINEVYDNPIYLSEMISASDKWNDIGENITNQIFNAPPNIVFILDIPILLDKLICSDDEVKRSAGKMRFILTLLRNISNHNILSSLIVVTKTHYNDEYPDAPIVGGRIVLHYSETIIRIDKLYSSNTRDGAMIILKHPCRTCNTVSPITF